MTGLISLIFISCIRVGEGAEAPPTVSPTRSASTYKVDLSGALIEGILKRGCWSNKSTWQQSYDKKIS